MIVELPTMDGLASHYHVRLTNTKRKQRGVEENERKDPKVSGFSFISCALAPYFGPKKNSLDFSLFSPFKTQHGHVFRPCAKPTCVH